MKRHVFLDPDGTASYGLYVIVHASTGVVYGHQCAGLATESRWVEGFLIPLATWDASREGPRVELDDAIYEFFARHFRGNCPPYSGEWTAALLDELAALVAQVPVWISHGEGSDDRTYLTLDRARVHELTEAWIPVQTPYGRATLVLRNSD